MFHDMAPLVTRVELPLVDGRPPDLEARTVNEATAVLIWCIMLPVLDALCANGSRVQLPVVQKDSIVEEY